MRARLALYAANIKVELREIVLRDKPAQMLEISPKGTVPVLQLTDGTIIDESLDIMIYALGRQDPEEFKYALDRYKYPDRYPDEDCSNMFDRGAEILRDLNTRIKQNGALIDDYNTLADYAIFPFVRQFANTDRDRFHGLNLKPLEEWLNNHLESDLFNHVMEKYKPWQPEDEPIMFGA